MTSLSLSPTSALTFFYSQPSPKDPLAVLPIYRSPSTTDWVRIVIVCFIHPVIQELVMMTTRLFPDYAPEGFKIILNDPRRAYFSLVNLTGPFTIETILVTFRRMMLGSMRDPVAIVLAVILTALEEALLRSTVSLEESENGASPSQEI